MTIIRGISQDGDQQVPESSFDAMPAGLARQNSFNLPDFTSLLESLSTPTLKLDVFFSQTEELAEACSTPTGLTKKLLQSVAAASAAPTLNNNNIIKSIKKEDTSSEDQAIPEPLSLDSNTESSFYTTESHLLKNITLVDAPTSSSGNTNSDNNSKAASTTQQLVTVKQEAVESPSTSPSHTSATTSMGIDNEFANRHRFAEGFFNTSQVNMQVKSEPESSGEELESEDNEQLTRQLTIKMDRCCRELNIARDPRLWSPQNVQQWASWIARESYNYSCSSLQHLEIDGTNLCMLGQMDFISRVGNEQLGQLLYIELDLWRSAFYIEMQQQQELLMQQQQSQFQAQQYPTIASLSQAPTSMITTTTVASNNCINSCNNEPAVSVYADLTNSVPTVTSSTLAALNSSTVTPTSSLQSSVSSTLPPSPSTSYLITSIPTPTNLSSITTMAASADMSPFLYNNTNHHLNLNSIHHSNSNNNSSHHHHSSQQQLSSSANMCAYSSQQQQQQSNGAYAPLQQQHLQMDQQSRLLGSSYAGSLWGDEDSSDEGSPVSMHYDFGGSSDIMMAEDDRDSGASTPSSYNFSPRSSVSPNMNTSSSSTRGSLKGSSGAKGPGNKRFGGAAGHTKHTLKLWEFLRELLLSPHLYNNCIRWVDQRKGSFKIEDSGRVAKLWGQRKNRPAMNYDKLSRSIRQYYKKGIIKKTEQSKRLVYQFCEAYL